MKPRQAKELILYEGREDEGIVVSLRMGKDPGPARMRELIHTIRVLFDRIEGQDKILREVAAALYALGTEVPAQIESWTRNGAKWREDLVHREMVNLLSAIESTFEGEWLAHRFLRLALRFDKEGHGPSVARLLLELALAGSLVGVYGFAAHQLVVVAAVTYLRFSSQPRPRLQPGFTSDCRFYCGPLHI